MSNLFAFLSNFGPFTMPAYQIWSCHVIQDANFENFLFFPNSTGKVTKFLEEKLSTSEVIPIAFWVKIFRFKTSFKLLWKVLKQHNVYS